MSRSVATAISTVAIAMIAVHGRAPLWTAQLLLIAAMATLITFYTLGDSGLDVGASLTLVGAMILALLILKFGGSRESLLAVGIVVSLLLSLSKWCLNRIDHPSRSTYNVSLLALLALGIGSLGVIATSS